ncbi:hypothetical protein HK102_002799 [Quaeritorhiza haematococci]|nr:hypothetical protein HK102_002799 [Quaeritorhiza haematococci]
MEEYADTVTTFSPAFSPKPKNAIPEIDLLLSQCDDLVLDLYSSAYHRRSRSMSSVPSSTERSTIAFSVYEDDQTSEGWEKYSCEEEEGRGAYHRDSVDNDEQQCESYPTRLFPDIMPFTESPIPGSSFSSIDSPICNALKEESQPLGLGEGYPASPSTSPVMAVVTKGLPPSTLPPLTISTTPKSPLESLFQDLELLAYDLCTPILVPPSPFSNTSSDSTEIY